MAYNLTPKQKEVARWLVDQVRKDMLPEEFGMTWAMNGDILFFKAGARLRLEATPEMDRGTFDALEENHLILLQRSTSYTYRCTMLGEIYKAVDANFDAPDISFVKYLSPLADVTNLDDELKKRCLPVLGTGSADPMAWDSAVRAALVVLEARLQDVGGITDIGRGSRDLVNDVFGKDGTLVEKFEVSSERVGYRDLFAGVVGAIRNRYAHHPIDPPPEHGGAIIVFVNLLLNMLEELR